MKSKNNDLTKTLLVGLLLLSLVGNAVFSIDSDNKKLEHDQFMESSKLVQESMQHQMDSIVAVNDSLYTELTGTKRKRPLIRIPKLRIFKDHTDETDTSSTE